MLLCLIFCNLHNNIENKRKDWQGAVFPLFLISAHITHETPCLIIQAGRCHGELLKNMEKKEENNTSSFPIFLGKAGGKLLPL
jgi:hypothetical protein